MIQRMRQMFARSRSVPAPRAPRIAERRPPEQRGANGRTGAVASIQRRNARGVATTPPTSIAPPRLTGSPEPRQRG